MTTTMTRVVAEPFEDVDLDSGGIPYTDDATLLFPGGATASETATRPGWVSLSVRGELDTFDKHSIVDVLTNYVLAGVRDIHIDACELTYLDVAAARSFQRVRRFLERQGGSLIVSGRSRSVDAVWNMFDAEVVDVARSAVRGAGAGAMRQVRAASAGSR